MEDECIELLSIRLCVTRYEHGSDMITWVQKLLPKIFDHKMTRDERRLPPICPNIYSADLKYVEIPDARTVLQILKIHHLWQMNISVVSEYIH